MSGKSKTKFKSVREKFAKITRGHSTLALVVIGVAMVGTILTILSSADTPYATSTNANDVVVQYSMPHVMMPISKTNLAPPMIPPFTLYGNGLLVCGHSSAMPFMGKMPMNASTWSAPTSRVLTQGEVQVLIARIVATGFFSLNKEYFKYPVSAAQETLRVSLTSGDHYVLYYRDVTAPAAYKATISILQSTCTTATQPYVSDQVTVRAIANADPKGASVADVSQLPAAAAPTVKSVIATATTNSTTASKEAQARSLSATATTTTQSPTASTVPAAQTVTGTAAQNIVKSQGTAAPTQYVSQSGTTYQVAADAQLPKVNNPLSVNYAGIRAQAASKGLGNHIKNLLNPHAYAATSTIPVRVVLLLASDGGNTNTLATAQKVGQAQYNWYCGQVGRCYGYQGVQVIRGSQTMSYYTSCHDLGDVGYCAKRAALSPDRPLENVLENVLISDYGTVYRNDVDTLIVTGWQANPTDTDICGIAYMSMNLGAVDYNNPPGQTSNGCFLGQASAHETGHTFGLLHTGNGTLMDGDPYAQFASYCDIGNTDTKIPVCKLDPNQSKLLSTISSYFPQTNLLPASNSAPSTLNAGQNLAKGQYLLSPGRQCEASLQNDGNFVVYNTALQSLFSTGTQGKAIDHLSMQTDGNFVIYGPGGSVVWDGFSRNKGGTHLAMQDDCNLVLYTATNAVVWSSKYGAVGPANLLPARGLAPTTLNAGQSMYPGNYLMSPGLQCEAVLQPDGNFVIYGTQLQVYFSTNTAGKPTNRASLQSDGNFVVYANSGGVLWDSTSHNKGGNRLVMQDDCNLVLYNGGNNAVWSSKYGPVGPQNLLSTIGSAPSTLYAGQNLYLNQYLLSPGAQCQASLQSDGNFVIYGAQLQVYWYTNTYGQPMNHLSMQTDNNFVFYANSGGRLWDPMLTGRGGNRLVMQDDCNLVLYNAANNPVWSSKTGYLPPNTLWGGENLFMGQYIRSPNGQYRAVLQTDGNFVVYNSANQALFNTHSQGHYDFLAMQTDGNVVVYDINYAVLYNANTWGVGGQRLVMQDDGNLVLYTAANVPLWCSFYGRMY